MSDDGYAGRLSERVGFALESDCRKGIGFEAVTGQAVLQAGSDRRSRCAVGARYDRDGRRYEYKQEQEQEQESDGRELIMRLGEPAAGRK